MLNESSINLTELKEQFDLYVKTATMELRDLKAHKTYHETGVVLSMLVIFSVQSVLIWVKYVSV